MEKRSFSQVKLGVFVIAGLLFLILLLYMIGKNRNFFGQHYSLTARFDNVDGLKPGNNVRYAGIDAGTVTSINILNDTTLEVSMSISSELASVIHTDAEATIGTDGLVGNKIVNITGARGNGRIAKEGDLIASGRKINTEEMLKTLYQTNNDIAAVAGGLKSAVNRLNTSKGIWRILEDNSLPANLRATALNVRKTTAGMDSIVNRLQEAVSGLRDNKGLLGTLLYDTSLNSQLQSTLGQIRQAGGSAEQLAAHLNKVTADFDHELNMGSGTLHALLKDTAIVAKLNRSLDNIQLGTDGFNQNMEALKHNFLFRGYFRKLEKQQAKQTAH